MDTGDDMQRLLEYDEPPFGEVMACVFGIQSRETRTYLTLLDQPGSTVEELADSLNRDRSNVNRSLSRLRDLKLARRERRLLEPGGYVYQYTATPLEETKAYLHQGLDSWADSVHEQIEEFETHSVDA